MLDYIWEEKTLKEAWGQPKEDIHTQHGCKETLTPSEVEQYTTKGYVDHQLYLEDHGVVWHPQIN